MNNHRVGLIVWMHHLKHARILRKYGSVHYISRRLKYAVLYCDQNEQASVIQLLKKQRFVKDVERSYLHSLRESFIDTETEMDV